MDTGRENGDNHIIIGYILSCLDSGASGFRF